MCNRKGHQSVNRGEGGLQLSLSRIPGLGAGAWQDPISIPMGPLAAALRAGCGDGGKGSGRKTSEETAALRQVPGGGGGTRGKQGVTLLTWHQLPGSVCPDSVTA